MKGIGTVATPTGKNISTRAVLPIYASDLGRLARDEKPVTGYSGKGKGKIIESKEGTWEEWGAAWVSYYVHQNIPPVIVTAPSGLNLKEPTTPTPARRTHLHTGSHHAQTIPISASKARLAEDVGGDASESTTAGGLRTLEIPYSKIKSAHHLEEILQLNLPELPEDCHYEFLQRLRVASALAGDPETRRKILATRILALTNLAYVHSESQFTAKVLALDGDEPRRLQLVYQLAELVQSSDGKKGGEVPRWLQTLALGGLEALARQRGRTVDVCTALSVNVNHGVLLYLVRKAVAELAIQDGDWVYEKEAEEWRDALFALVGFLPSANNAGSMLVSAGLIPIMVDHLQLRTKKALRHVPKTVNFLDQLLYQVNPAFQAFANAKGLDVIVDLVSSEVKAGLEDIQEGRGIPSEHKTQQTDYEISYYRQQTLKMVFKFMRNLMQQSGGNADRLLRNLIDNPALLEAIKIVISKGNIFGSNVWSLVMGLVSAFIHNEPTSYAVVHEAGVTHAFLESITGRTGLAEEEAQKKKDEAAAAEAKSSAEQGPSAVVVGSSSEAPADVEGASDGGEGSSKAAAAEKPETEEPLPPRLHSLAKGIMTTSEAISSIPTAFGAICLNASGLAVFQASGALETYFEIFESPEHVKQLAEADLANLLGSQFDELVRHHPVLRESVMTATLSTVRRIADLGKTFAVEKGMGAKVWLDDGSGGLVVAGGRRALVGGAASTKPSTSAAATEKGNARNTGEDVEMSDADAGLAVPLVEPLPDGSLLDEVITLADVVDEEAETEKNAPPAIAEYIDVLARYLDGFIANGPQSKEFLRRGGLDRLLQFYRLPSLPHDFATCQANQMLCRVVQLCCEHNLLETLKAVFVSAREAVEELQPLLKYESKTPYFAPLTSPTAATATVVPPRLQGGIPPNTDSGAVKDEVGLTVEDPDVEAEKQAVENVKANGTKLVKDLVTMHSLSFLLQDLYHASMFNARQSIPLFLQTTQSAEGDGLIANLGALQRLCVWEEILLQNGIPDTWNEATRVKDSATATAAAIEEGAVPQQSGSNSTETQGEGSKSTEEKEAEKAAVEKDGKTSWFRNVKTIRYLISQIPNTINPFLQGLSPAIYRNHS